MSILPHHSSDALCALCALKLRDAHPSLVDWFNTRVKPKFLDAHISWSFRDETSQEQAYTEGKSKLHWPDSKHNSNPSLAIDLFEINDAGQAMWSPKFFFDVNEMNQANGEKIIWGGTFKSLSDGDHFQLDQ